MTLLGKVDSPTLEPAIAWVPHPTRTLRRVGYETLTPQSLIRLGFGGERFVVSYPFDKETGEGCVAALPAWPGFAPLASPQRE
jgi:hypothetical protein